MFAAPIKGLLQTLNLLLPAVVPSWRFFDIIAPSPRIEFTLLQNAQQPATDWQEFRPRPSTLPFRIMLKRMFWNPSWNEALFVVSCAERLISTSSEHSLNEIRDRIKAELNRSEKKFSFFQFRLILVSRENGQIKREVVFVSPAYGCAGNE